MLNDGRLGPHLSHDLTASDVPGWLRQFCRQVLASCRLHSSSMSYACCRIWRLLCLRPSLQRHGSSRPLSLLCQWNLLGNCGTKMRSWLRPGRGPSGTRSCHGGRQTSAKSFRSGMIFVRHLLRLACSSALCMMMAAWLCTVCMHIALQVVSELQLLDALQQAGVCKHVLPITVSLCCPALPC